MFLAALVIYELAFFGLLQFVDDDDDSGKGTRCCSVLKVRVRDQSALRLCKDGMDSGAL